MNLTNDYSWAHKSSWLVCHIEYDTSLVQKNPQMSATKFLFFVPQKECKPGTSKGVYAVSFA